MKEIWKDIKGYEGYYQISNTGRVRGLERYVVNNSNGGKRKISEVILKPMMMTSNYYYVGLKKNNKRKNYSIHRLMAKKYNTTRSNISAIIAKKSWNYI